MKTTIVARKMDLTAGLRDYVEKKLTKLDKFFDDEAEAKVTMSVEKNLQKIEDEFETTRALFAEGPALALRCKGIGYMSKKEAIKGRAVGPIGRASGVKEISESKS